MTGALESMTVNHAAVIRYLGLDPSKPADQALVLVGQRYDLDPLLGEVCLIQGKVYVTERGLWTIAHRSGQLDGVEEPEETVEGDEYVARVKVWRRDMRFPFPGEGRYPKAKKGTAGRRMARKSAFMEALRMGFGVALPTMPVGMEDDGDRPVARPVEAVPLPTEGARAPAGQAHTPAPPPELPGEGKTLEPAQRLAMMGRDAGLDDNLRHLLVAFITGDAEKRSTKDLDTPGGQTYVRIVSGLRRGDKTVLKEITDPGLAKALNKAVFSKLAPEAPGA